MIIFINCLVSIGEVCWEIFSLVVAVFLRFLKLFYVFMTSFVILFQRIRSTVDEKEQKQLLMDLDVVMRSSDCPYIVQFYGALFREVGMDCSGFS